MLPGTIDMELLIGDPQKYQIALYVATTIVTVFAAKVSDMIKDADAEKKGLVKDGKGYYIESNWIPPLVGILVVPFVWAVAIGTGMTMEMSLATAVLMGYASREFLATKIAAFMETL